MKRLAVLSDIHGNSIALQAVLADLKSQGGVDSKLILGDLAAFGPDPAGALALLEAQKNAFFVCGNTDRYLFQGQYPYAANNHDWQIQVQASFPWTARQLGERGLHFLAGLPTQQLLRLDGEHTVLAVHGSPRSDEENIRPETPDLELRQMLGDLPYDLLLCGHTHLPLDRKVARRRVVNVGSVGLPFDNDPRASYVLIGLRPGGGYDIDFRRVAYDVEAAVFQLTAADHPAARVSTYNLRTARPIDARFTYAQQAL